MKGPSLLAGFVVFTLLGNFFFKRGAMELSPANFSLTSLISIVDSPNVWIGVICYGLAAVFWFVSLVVVPLNLAITVSACVYIIVILMAFVLFGESMPPARWGGVALVFSGLIIIGRTL